MCLQLDESNNTNPFVCFRRRDPKAVCKTRHADNTPAEKITRLRIELQQVSDLAVSVVTREMKKAELGKDSQNVLEARLRLFDHKRRFPHLSSPQDDQMLIEQERPPHKAAPDE
jgi:enhancer of polycomb-like protein